MQFHPFKPEDMKHAGLKKQCVSKPQDVFEACIYIVLLIMHYNVALTCRANMKVKRWVLLSLAKIGVPWLSYRFYEQHNKAADSTARLEHHNTFLKHAHASAYITLHFMNASYELTRRNRTHQHWATAIY